VNFVRCSVLNLFYFTLFTLSLSSVAAGLTIKDIVISGQAKVEKAAITTIIGSKKGTELDPEIVQEDIVALYELGYFSDIRVYKENVVGGVRLILQLVEKPAIMEINYEGLEEISESDLKDKLVTKLYGIVDEGDLTQDLRMIEKHYLEKGFYLATASYELTPIEDRGDREVRLTFNVDEGGKVLVGDVHILGNEYFSDAELIDKFISRPITRSSSFSSPGSVYHDDFVNRDADFIAYLYRDQGFAEIKVGKPIKVIDEDRRYVRLTFDLEEGNQYRVGSIKVSGDILFDEEELKQGMMLKKGDLFRFTRFRKDIEYLYDRYGDKGYANANVEPLHNFDKENKLVNLDYRVTKGEKIYFGTMTIVGNTKTRDNVIRREFLVADGGLYSGTNLTKSKQAVQRLGYFEEVQFIKKRSLSKSNVLDYRIRVKEKPTGQLQAALGYNPGGGGGGAFAQGKYSEDNQSGKGWRTSFTGKWNGQEDYEFNLGLTDPRVNDSYWSAGFSGTMKHTTQQITSDISAISEEIGGNFTLGKRVYELIRASLTYRASETKQTSTQYIMPRFRDNGIYSTLTFVLSRNATNNFRDPSEGSVVSISQSISGGFLGGDNEYLETSLVGTYYYPIDITETYRTYFRFYSRAGLVQPYGDNDIPYSRRYKLGGPENLRAWNYLEIGPPYAWMQSPGSQAVVINKGGNKELLFQLEYFFPIIPAAGIKGLVFADAGRVFDEPENFEVKKFRQDVGFGIRWQTPIAPFRFEFAHPYENGKLGRLKTVFYLGI